MGVDIVKIFPPIGIARLGNSPEFFVGPEFPGTPPPSGGHKDSQFRVKRQGARFRLFGYQAGSSQAKEITLDDADEITWSVELANSKGEAEVFGTGKNVPTHAHLHPRNNSKKGKDRDSLIIKPGSRTLTITPAKPDVPRQVFDTGSFLTKKNIYLGEILSDYSLPDGKGKGRLIVLGGKGFSESPIGTTLGEVSRGDEDGGWEGNFADNDGWYDDVSDGPVNASVRMKGTKESIDASPAWVICAPPKFAPQIQHVITLYDTLLQVASDRSELRNQLDPAVLPADPPSFTNDIYPLLLRALNMKWVSSPADVMHRTLRQLLYGTTGPYGSPGQREAIFYHLRDPSTDHLTPSSGQDMPKIWSDYYKVQRDPTLSPPYPSVTEALTNIQYHFMEQWEKDNFQRDWPVSGPPVAETAITPDGLTRAALENCVGGAFYPGIETSFNIRDLYAFVEPFRLDASKRRPGDLTKQMCVPWQTDFFDCQPDNGPTDDGTLLDWWPAQRPVDVFQADQPDSTSPVLWTRDLIRAPLDMIHNWYKLGFVVMQGDRYVETERNA